MTAAASPLACRVLVLNKHYMAVRITDAKRAFSLLVRGLGEVIDCDRGYYANYDFASWVEVSQAKRAFQPDDHDWIHTVRLTIAVPRVVRLLFYDNLPRQNVTLNRRNIFARDHYRCQYCGRKVPTSELSLDHVVPKTRGGGTSWENLVCACVSCNVRKGGRPPAEAGMTLITQPVRPKRCPQVQVKLAQGRYRSWQQFLDHAYWSVELK